MLGLDIINGQGIYRGILNTGGIPQTLHRYVYSIVPILH